MSILLHPDVHRIATELLESKAEFDRVILLTVSEL